VTLTIDTPTSNDPYQWWPSGTVDVLPSGPTLLLYYTLAHPNAAPSNGMMGSQMTINGPQETWRYPSQQSYMSDLQSIGFTYGDTLTLTARLYDSSFNLVASSTTITGGNIPAPIYPPPMVIPDVAAAVTVRLKRAPQIQALCDDRVSIVLKSSWNMPKYAIIISSAGGAGPDQETDRHFARLDIRFFGPGDDYNVRSRNAMTLWRTAHPVLVPPVALRISTAFHAAHCIVHNIRQDLEPMRITEPGTDWPIVLVPYVVSYMASPI